MCILGALRRGALAEQLPKDESRAQGVHLNSKFWDSMWGMPWLQAHPLDPGCAAMHRIKLCDLEMIWSEVV